MTTAVWVGFVVLVLALLVLDLGVFNKTPNVVSTGEALGWTTFWVALALVFNAGVYLMYKHHWLGIGIDVGHSMTGRQAALEFFTAYVVEKSLSLDNIFVIAMVFSYFGVPALHQRRVLFWGIVGAVALRAVMIIGGLALLQRFSWLTYVFGALLLATAVRVMVVRHDSLQPDKNPLLRLIRRWYPVTDDYRGAQLMVIEGGKRMVTPLLLALVIVGTTDLLFAADSIGAVFAITTDPFLVLTSNVFAVLGLRSLYFALAAVMDRFRYLKFSLVFVLAFVGVKLLLVHHYRVPVPVALAGIAAILGVGVAASVLAGSMDTAPLASPLGGELERQIQLTYRRWRKVLALVVGTTLLLVGAALIVLPGPGSLVILAGLAVLATEFVWARIWYVRFRDTIDGVTTAARGVLRGRRDSGVPSKDASQQQPDD